MTLLTGRLVRLALPLGVVLALVAALPVWMLLGSMPGAPSASLAASACRQAPEVGPGRLSAVEVASLAGAAGFPEAEISTAVAIARAESDWTPTATNVNTNGSVDHGLFQINDVNASVLAGGDWRDPADNAVMAFKIWKAWGNWRAWSTFNSGSYRKFLVEVGGDVPGCVPEEVIAQGDCPPNAKGYSNGQIPRSALCPLLADGDQVLRSDAANRFNALTKAYLAEFGRKPCVTDAYRTRAEQEALWRTKPGLAARPGTSNHGWGLALDLCDGVNRDGTATHEWMETNGPRFGWVWPDWARGAKFEPWHFECEACGAR